MGEVLDWRLRYLHSLMIDKLLQSPRKKLLQQIPQIEQNRQGGPCFQMPVATSSSVSFPEPKIKKEGKESTSIMWWEMQGDASEMTMQVKLAFVTEIGEWYPFP